MNYPKYLRFTLIGGLFLSLIIPFLIANGSVLPNMFFPFITGKNFFFRILVELLFGVYVIVALRDPRYRPRFSWVLASVVLFALWVGIADIFSVDPVKSFWSNFERMEGYITVLHLLAYFFIASATLSVERLWNWFFRFSVGASALMGLYGLMQLLGKITIDQGGTRLDGTLGNATYLAVYMLFNIFFAILLTYREWNNVALRFVYGAVIALDVVILFGTETRGTILGLIVGLLCAGGYMLFAGRHTAALRKTRKYVIGGLVAIVILIVGFIAVRNVPAVQHAPGFSRLASISLSDKTTQSRFMIWDMALQGVKERPIVGWGQENFNYVFNKFYNPAMYDQEQWFDRAHNAFIDWFTVAGIPGLLFFLSMFGAAAWAILRRETDLSVPERAIFLGLIAGFGFHELFVFDNIVSYIQFFTVLALLHALSQREVHAKVWLSRPLSDNAIAIAAPVVAVVIVAGGWFLNAGGIANATGLIEAIQTTNATGGAPDLNQNLAAFNKVLSGSPLGRQEAVEQLMQFTPSVAQSSATTPALTQAFYTTALQSITSLTNQRKGDARLELFLGAFLDQFGQYPAGLQVLQEAHKDSPNKQQILFEIGMNNMLRSGDAPGALAVLKQAYELDKSYNTAADYYAAGLFLNGQAAAADQLLMTQFGTTTPDESTLLQVYFDTKQYARAEAILEARLAANPNNAQGWLQLAAVFYAAGDKKSTVAVLEKGAAAVPSFASQAYQLIGQVQSEK